MFTVRIRVNDHPLSSKILTKTEVQGYVRVCLCEGVEGHKTFPSKKKESVAEAMHVFCRRSPHMKQADEKRAL